MPMRLTGPARCSCANTVAVDAAGLARASGSVSSPRPVSAISRFRSTRSGATYQRPLSVNAPRPVAGRSVRASLAEQSTFHPRPMATGRRDIEIGFGEIEAGLIVAELEIDAAVADLNRRAARASRTG